MNLNIHIDRVVVTGGDANLHPLELKQAIIQQIHQQWQTQLPNISHSYQTRTLIAPELEATSNALDFAAGLTRSITQVVQ